MAVLELCHRVVLTDAIREEWRLHASRFTRTWLVQMYARKKVVVGEPSDALQAELRRRLATKGVTGRALEAATKDLHLVSAALRADRVVLSAGRSVAEILGRARLGRLRSLDWAHPADAEVGPWLREGAPAGAFPLPTTVIDARRRRRR